MPGFAREGDNRCRENIALALLLLVAAVQRAWNALSLPPLIGYDAPAHAGYVLTILDERRLPDPLEGWATFHPPIYYLLGSVVWRLLEPLGSHAIETGLRGLGALAGLAAGWVAFVLVRRLGGSAVVAWVAAALVLFLPSAQMAGVMVGNEALAAGFAALALPAVLVLQRDPGDPRAAVAAGLLAGLALATKFTGLWVAVACVVPFLRPGLDRRARSALVLCLLEGGVIAGPVYLRNLARTGSLFPMPRAIEPIRSLEAAHVIRPRQATDYVWIDPTCILTPSILVPASAANDVPELNRDMVSVWCLAHASLWYDPFGHRIAHHHPVRRWSGPLLTVLGVFPTLIMLLGFAQASVALVRSRLRAPDAPLTAMAFAGLATFVAFTWKAASTTDVKGSYLLPLAVPAAVFFARGMALVGVRTRRLCLAVSLAAALAAAVVFTNGLVHRSEGLAIDAIREWQWFGRVFPTTHLGEAIQRLAGASPPGQ